MVSGMCESSSSTAGRRFLGTSLREREHNFRHLKSRANIRSLCSSEPVCQDGIQGPRLLGHRQSHQRSACCTSPLRTHTLPPSDFPALLNMVVWHADLLYGSKSGVFQYNQALNITTRTADGGGKKP